MNENYSLIYMFRLLEFMALIIFKYEYILESGQWLRVGAAINLFFSKGDTKVGVGAHFEVQPRV